MVYYNVVRARIVMQWHPIQSRGCLESFLEEVSCELCLRTSRCYSGREAGNRYLRLRTQQVKKYTGKREQGIFGIWLEKWIHVREREKLKPEREAKVKL